MKDKSLVAKILAADGSVTISGNKDQPLSERLTATFSERLPKNSTLIRDVLGKSGTVTIQPKP